MDFENLYNLLNEEKKKKDSDEDLFDKFLEKRKEGAKKIESSAREKGGYSILTATHFKAKEIPYKESEKWADKKDKKAHYKKKAKETLDKLRDLDSLTQKEFQALTGELEVWGEVYIRLKEGKTKFVD